MDVDLAQTSVITSASSKNIHRYRSQKEVAELLRQFERKTDIFKYQHNGISIWQLLRASVALRLQNLPISSNPIPRSEIFAACLKGLKIWPLFRGFYLKNIEFLFFTYYSGLRLTEQYGHKDVYVDDYLKEISGGAKVNIFNAKGYRTKLNRLLYNPIYDISGFKILAAVTWRLFPLKPAFADSQKISELITNEFGLDCFDTESVQREIRAFIWHSRYYRFFLRILKPKVCFVPDTGERALMHACKLLNIKYIEIQHGIYCSNHRDAFPSDAAKYSISLLLPDHIAMYGKFWEDKLVGSLYSDLGIGVAVGNPVLEHYRKVRLIRGTKAKDRLEVVLTTNGVDTLKLAKFISECLSICSSHISIIIKLHPISDTDTVLYKQIEAKYEHCQVISGRENPNTFELIASADLHISIASACHYDSLSIGTPTAIIALAGHELMLDLVGKGYAKLLSSPNQILDLIEAIKEGDLSVPVSMQEEFCAANSVQNLKSLLKS